PGMGILVLEPAARDQHPGIGQRLDDGVVGVALFAGVGEHALGGEARRVVGERTVLVDGVGNRRVDANSLEESSVLHPNVAVLSAVTWRGMDEAGAYILGDLIACKQGHPELIIATEPLQGM